MSILEKLIPDKCFESGIVYQRVTRILTFLRTRMKISLAKAAGRGMGDVGFGDLIRPNTKEN